MGLDIGTTTSKALIRPLGDVLVVMPPLAITADELAWMVDAIESCIEAELGPSP